MEKNIQFEPRGETSILVSIRGFQEVNSSWLGGGPVEAA